MDNNERKELAELLVKFTKEDWEKILEFLTISQDSDVVTAINTVESSSTVEGGGSLRKDKLSYKIRDVLQKIGIPQHILGYRYLSEAIILFYKDKNYIHSMTTKLYPEIAKKCNTSPSRVERSIRHALKVATSTVEFKTTKDKIFKVKNKKLSNSYAIAALTEYIKYKV